MNHRDKAAELNLEKGLPNAANEEKFVLAAAMIDVSGKHVPEIVGTLSSEDFLLEKHRRIFRAICRLHEREEAVDRITVAHELMRNNELESVDGLSYLVELENGMPALDNISAYLNIVLKVSKDRKLAYIGNALTNAALSGVTDPEELASEVAEALAKLAEHKNTIGLMPIADVIRNHEGGLNSFLAPHARETGIKTGFERLDQMTRGLHPGEVTIIAARPSMGKTALSLNIAWHVGVRLGKPVAIFSLEMPKEALLLRMICAAARVDSARFMSGYLNQGERQKIRTAAQEAIDSPIWIDDASDATVNDMHGRLQEFERKIGRSIGVTVVDYLQLMTSKEKARNDNRTTEVGAISRGLKILSKKMNCPFLVLSQLSRACETRNEHRPQLSDLRESGCLAGDVLIALSDSGLYVPIRELVGVESLYVWAVNEKTRRSVKMPGRAFKSGTKQVFSLTTRLGKKIRATANHKFLTIGGWVPLGDLKILDRIALPRVLSPSLQQTIPDEELAFMAHMIGNGTALPRQPIHYVSGDPVLAEATCIYAKAIWGDAVNVRWQKSKAGNWWEAFFSSSKRVSRKHHSPVVVWLKQMGMYGKRAPEKEIPAVVFRQPQDAVARFLMHLWSTDGCYSGPCPYYSTTSEALARGVQSLLLRIGVTAILKPKKEGVYRDSWTVTVSGAEDVMRFLNVVGAIGTNRMAAAQRLREETESLEPNTNRDSFPASVWETHILPTYKGQGYTQRAFQAAIGSAYSGTSLYNQNIGRCRLKRIADTLHSSELLAMAEGDVYWDEVSEIREDGIEDVFDIEVPILHNFVASDMYVHNSIEQDADNIMAIFREEVYKRDREDLRGLAELVILKQRNGPVGEVKLIWLAQQTRFESRAEDIEPMDGSLPYAD